MTEDYFWGLTLNKDNKKETWDPDAHTNNDDSHAVRGEHTLVVKQVLLGQAAINSPGEVNVIQVEAMGFKSDIQVPIAVLKSGQQNSAFMDLLFPDPPVTFKLVEGNGPVYILGNHSVGRELVGEDDDEDEELDDELDEEDMDGDFEEMEKSMEDKKRKIVTQVTNSKPKAKKSKVEEK
uniref:Nucleoplasmin core domain-containing protein n=1 Tax=Clastoptera arizonana TaxID=38151 RepID=A0A1B6DQV2_9HEMI